jgi:hypothetical protein
MHRDLNTRRIVDGKSGEQKLSRKQTKTCLLFPALTIVHWNADMIDGMLLIPHL